MITLDDTDQEFVADTLNRAISIHEMRMTDPSVCEANRDRAYDLAKITRKALDIVKGRSESLLERLDNLNKEVKDGID